MLPVSSLRNLHQMLVAGLTKMTSSEHTPLSPRVFYPRIGVSGLGAAVDVHSHVGLRDGTIAAGDVDDSKGIKADADDA